MGSLLNQAKWMALSAFTALETNRPVGVRSANERNCRFGIQNTRGDFSRGRRPQNRATKKGQRPKDRHFDKGFSKRLVGSWFPPSGSWSCPPFLLCFGCRFCFGVFCLLLVWVWALPALLLVSVLWTTTFRFYGPRRGGCFQRRTLDGYPFWPQGRYGFSVTEVARKQNVHVCHVVDLMQLFIYLIPNCSRTTREKH